MNADQQKALRAPFKPEQIGKLPKPTKKDNPRGRCETCGGWHGLPAVHLDYVGHAAVTDRLLAVDPEWTWEPVAVGPNGEPLIVREGLWIRLTVAGVTRYGFGDATMGHSVKEMIGDAIRNAAMRFGVALDLWAKETLDAADEPAERTAAPVVSTGDFTYDNEPQQAPGPSPVTKPQHAQIGVLVKKIAEASNQTTDSVAKDSRAWCKERFGVGSRAELSAAQASELIDYLNGILELAGVPFS